MDLEGIEPFLAQLNTGNDRTVALAGGAALEQLLVQSLQAHFIDLDDRDLALTFYEPDALLGSFSRRTTLCLLLGIISRSIRDDLDRIRRIRNVFAHRIHDLEFSHPQIAEVCEKLENFVFKPSPGTPTRLRFLFSVISLHTIIREREVLLLHSKADRIVEMLEGDPGINKEELARIRESISKRASYDPKDGFKTRSTS